MSATRPSEADVEALAKVLLSADDSVDMRYCVHVAEQALASDWLASRDAEHEREAMDRYWEGYGAGKDEAETRDLNYDAMTDRTEAAERALADRDAAIKALAEMWVRDEDEGIEHVVGCQDYRCRECVVIACATDLRALLPRDDAAGAGGAS